MIEKRYNPETGRPQRVLVITQKGRTENWAGLKKGRSRRDDYETSEEAAERVNDAHCQQYLELYRTYSDSMDGMATFEAEGLLWLGICPWKRIGELRREGYLEWKEVP